jgi:hypothetical protein
MPSRIVVATLAIAVPLFTTKHSSISVCIRSWNQPGRACKRREPITPPNQALALWHRAPGAYWRLVRYEWSEPSLIGSLMMMSPLRILILYKQEGLVQTQALYSMEAPWLPKSESGTRSPSLHLRHRGKANSTKSPPSFSLEDIFASLTQITQ